MLSLIILIISHLLVYPQEKPNVLLILVDDLNTWIGAMHGHPDAYTPNIDRLVTKGVLFGRTPAGKREIFLADLEDII